VSQEEKIEYHQLSVGYEFPPSSYRLDAATVAAYCQAVEETGDLYHNTGLVPPMAVAAYAMASLAGHISMPPGAIHVSQEMEFLNEVTTEDTITSHPKVSRNQDRGRFHMLTIDLNVCNQHQQAVLAGKTSFILPQQNDDGA